MKSHGLEAYDKVRQYYNYKVDSYESKYKSGHITHLHTGLFNPDVLQTQLGSLKVIQDNLIQGQARLTQKVIDLIPTDSKHVLDIGCGHGGTAFTFANQRTGRVEMLTISDRQEAIVRKRAEQLGLTERIHVVLDNILTHNFQNKRFETAVGVESFCQIDHVKELSRIVHELLEPDGYLIVSDYYSSDPEFKERFDKHWCCAVKPFAELRLNLENRGLVLINKWDYTLGQAPFWKLSALYSSLKLQQPLAEQELSRLQASKAFHEYMYSAFRQNIGHYYITIFQKKN